MSWDSDRLDLLLYTTQALQPGDIFLSDTRVQWRSYRPSLTYFDYRSWFWYMVGLFGRQWWQVMDNTNFDFDKWLYMQGIDWVLYDTNIYVIDHKSLGMIDNTRQWFLNKIVQKYWWQEVVVWLIGGLTVGDRSHIDSDRYQQFIDSGLVHLIAVSGGNIAIIVLFVGLLLFRVPFYIRQVLLMLTIICYAMIVWDDSSIIRAAVMWLLTIIVLFPGRQLSIWRSLAYARVGMLLWNPYYLLYDLWFLLSFFALAGIIWIEHVVQKRKSSNILWNDPKKSLLTRWGEYAYRMYVLPTLGAMLGVTPILLRSMSQINLLSILANIFVVPFIPLITIAWFILPFVYSWTWLDGLYLTIIDILISISALTSQYGVYLVISPVWKNIFLLGCLIWWIREIRKIVTSKKYKVTSEK
jgi:ComEC/Rec2-related protein